MSSGPGENGWKWSPTGSIPGTGTGEDPAWVWDPEADDLVASLMERGLVDDVNAKQATWTTNWQALPAVLPADVRKMGRAACRERVEVSVGAV